MGVLATHVSNGSSKDSSSSTRRQRRTGEEDSSFGEVVVLNKSFVVPPSPLRKSKKHLSNVNITATATSTPFYQGSSSTRIGPRQPQRQESDNLWLNIEDGPEPWSPRRQRRVLTQQPIKSCFKSPTAYPFPADLQASTSSRHGRKTLTNFLLEEEQRHETQSLPCRNAFDTATFISEQPGPPPLMYSPASSSSSSVSSFRMESESESTPSSRKSGSRRHNGSTRTTRNSSNHNVRSTRLSCTNTTMTSPLPRDSSSRNSRTKSSNQSPRSSHAQTTQEEDKEMPAFPKAGTATATISPERQSTLLLSLLQNGATAPTSRDMPHWIRRRLETKLRQDEIEARMVAAASSTSLFASLPLQAS
jgi:hypothetical protein